MIKNVKIDYSIVEKVIAFFDLHNPINIKYIKEGISNSNYEVKTSEGVYIVQLLSINKERTIENVLSIHSQMRKTRILIPKYISNKDGLCMYKDNELVAVVYKKILGITPKTVNKTLAYEFGKCLAIFHKCVIKLPYNNRNALVDQVNSGIKTNLYAKNLPKGIIHGDLHLGNVMVESDKNLKITALLDFEEAHINLLIIDIAVTVMATCSKNNGTRVDIDLIRNTISGYQSIRKLEKFEKQNFKEAVNYVALCWIEWFKNNDYVKYAKRHLKRLNNFNKLNQGDYF